MATTPVQGIQVPLDLYTRPDLAWLRDWFAELDLRPGDLLRPVKGVLHHVRVRQMTPAAERVLGALAETAQPERPPTGHDPNVVDITGLLRSRGVERP